MTKNVFLLGALLLMTLTVQAQFTMNNSQTPQQLVQNVLLGSGVTVSNVNFTGDPLQIGEFTNATPNNLGLTHGLVLASGATDVLDDFPTNQSDFSTFFVNGAGGDPDLDALLANGNTTNDAAVLEFDFVPLSDTIRFRYVFGSEEYNEYVCSNFNDIFAFLISGPGFAPNTNLALIPNTTIPVSINSVNIGTPGINSVGTCNGPNESLAHANLFLNNAVGTVGVEYDGLTVVLTAIAVVQPCQTYHIKLAIADVTDFSFDSGVFLEANSFTSNVLDIQVNSYLPNGQIVEGCTNAGVTLALNAPATSDYTIPIVSVGGTATQGVDYLNLPPALVIPAGQQSVNFTVVPFQDNIIEGQETVQIIFQSSTCTQDTLNLIIREDGILTLDQTRFAVCSGSNTSLNFNALVFNDPGTPGTFTWSPTVGLSNPNIRNPVATVNQATNYTVTYNSGGCTQTATLEVLTPFDVNIPELRDTALCGGATSVVLDATLPPNNAALNFSIAGPVTVNPEQSIDIPIVVSGLPAPIVVNGIIQSLCIDLTQDPTAFQYYTELYLIAPTGEISALTVQSGTGAGFNNLCFDVSATDSIAQYAFGTIPGNTSLQPQDPARFDDLNGALLNGTWHVRVFNWVPASFGNTPLILNNATLNFSNINSTNYTWTPGTDLSCTTCPAPVCTPTASPRSYNLTVTNGFGCSATEQVSVYTGVMPTPQVTCGIANNVSVQFNWDAVGGAAGYTVSINGGAPQNVGQATTFTATGLTHPQSVGISVIALAPAGSACGNSAPGTLTCATTNCAPINPSITGVLAFCNGGQAVLGTTPTFASYEWSNNLTTPQIVTTVGGTYTVTVTAANGCQGSATVNVTAGAVPVATITGNAIFCDGTTTTLTAPAGFTYAWATPTGLQTTQSVTADATANYIVTITNASGCTGSASRQVTEVNSPTIANVQENCDFTGGQYNISFTINNGDPTSYVVTGIAGTITGNVFSSAFIPTSQHPTLTLTDANNCSPVTYTGIGVCQAPSYCSPSSGCYGANLITDGDFESFNQAAPFTNFTSDYDYSDCTALNNTCTSNGVNILCQYDFSVAPVPTPCNPDWSNQATDHTSGFGNMMIVDFPAGLSSRVWCQTINLPSNTEYCFGTYALNLLPPGSNQPLPRLRFVINNANVGVSNVIGETGQWQFEGVDFNSGSGGNLTLCIYNDNFGQVGYDLALDDIALRPIVGGAPPITLPDSASTCANTQTVVNPRLNDLGGGSVIIASTLTVESAPPFTDGTAQVDPFGSNTITFTPAPGFTGATNFTYRICNQAGCCAIDTVFVNVTSGLVVNAGVDQTVCSGDAINLNATVQNGSGFLSYFWLNNSGFFFDFNNPTTDTPLNTDTYFVQVNDSNGCFGSDTLEVTVVPNPNVTISSAGGTNICLGTPVTLTANGGNAQSTYAWSTGDNTPTITVTPTTTGQVNYSVTITNAPNCADGSVRSLVVVPVPILNMDSIDVECFGGNNGAASVNVTPAGNYNYTWQPGGGNTASIANLSANTYSVTVSTTSGIICSSTSSVVVNDGPVVSVDAGADITINLGETATLTATPNNSSNTYTWVGQDGSTFTGNPVTVSPTDTTLYILNATIGNCAAVDSILVIVRPEGIYRFPTAFTPNGDEQNDGFYPAIQGAATLVRFDIFDRWGNKVHSNASSPWDGAHNGTPLPRDVYVYYAVIRQPDGREFAVKGDVTLLR